MSNRVVCSACGTPITVPDGYSEETIICKACDSDVILNPESDVLDFAEEEKLFCPNCKKTISSDDVICTSCGVNLKTGEGVFNRPIKERYPVKIKSLSSRLPFIIVGSVIIIVALAGVIYFVFSSVKKPVDWVKLIPKESWLLECCDPQRIFDLPSAEENKKKIEDNVGSFFNSISVSLKDIKQIYFYIGHGSQIGCVIKGDFKSQKASQIIKKKRSKIYKGNPLLDINLMYITEALMCPIGPCIFNYLKDLKPNFSGYGSLTFLDDETIVMGNTSGVENIIDCYNEEKPAFAGNSDMVALVNKPNVKGILWIVAEPPSQVIEEIQKNFSNSFEKFEKDKGKDEFLSLKNFILTLDASSNNPSNYSLECESKFRSKTASMEIEFIVYERFKQVETKLKELSIPEAEYIKNIHIKSNEDNVNFTLDISPNDSKSIWKLLNEYTNTSGLMGIEASKKWDNISKLPEEDINQIFIKKKSLQEFIAQYNKTSPAHEASKLLSVLEKKEKGLKGEIAFTEFKGKLKDKDIFTQWKEWNKFLKEHSEEKAEGKARDEINQILKLYIKEISDINQRATESIKEGKYDLAKIPDFQNWASGSNSSMKELIDSSPEIKREVDKLISLSKDADAKKNAQAKEREREAISKLEKEFQDYQKDYFQSIKDRDYQEPIEKLKKYMKSLEAFGSEGTETEVYKNIKLKEDELNRILSVWEKAREGVRKGSGKDITISPSKKYHGRPVNGKILRLDKDQLYLRLSVGEVGYKFSNLSTDTIAKIAEIVDKTPELQENIALLKFIEDEYESSQEILQRLMKNNPSPHVGELLARVQDKLGYIKKEQEEEQGAKIVEKVNSLLEKVTKAMKENTPEDILEVLSQLKSNDYKILILLNKEIKTLALKEKNVKFSLGILAKMGLTGCSICKGNGTITCPDCKDKKDTKKTCPRCGGKKTIPCPSCYARRNNARNKAMVEFYEKLDKETDEQK